MNLTIQQEAYKLIDTLPDDSVKIIIQLMYRMNSVPKQRQKTFRFQEYVTPTERADYAQEQIRELRENDRV